MAICLTPFFGCSANRAYVAAPCAPPVVYMQDVPEPHLKGRTNRDLAAWAIDLREALRRSNLDKLHLREWLAGRSPNDPPPHSAAGGGPADHRTSDNPIEARGGPRRVQGETPGRNFWGGRGFFVVWCPNGNRTKVAAY